MSNLVLHPDTKRHADSLRPSPPQSLLLFGEKGVGLLTIATSIVNGSPIVVTPEGEGQALSIKTERIRQLYDETRGSSKSKQFVIIDDAELMTNGAQSAFLKLLEEPNPQMHFILTSHDKDTLLPTILSRVQAHHLPLPTESDASNYMRSLIIDPAIRQKVTFLAPRHPSLIYAYANDIDRFEKDSALMSDARKVIVAKTNYERQALALSHASTRPGALEFIDACIHLLRYGLAREATTKNIKSVELYLATRDALTRNVNVKLALARLMVQ